MDHTEVTPRYRERPGTCHRCGWRGMVSTVRRRERKHLPSGQSFARLCDDCLHELVGPPVDADPEIAQAPAPLRVVKQRVVKHRVVA
jgi:hypothetical protein